MDDESTGLVVPVGDDDGLRAALVRIGIDEGLRARLGAAAREHAATAFGVDRFMHETGDLHEEMARLRQTRAARGAGAR